MKFYMDRAQEEKSYKKKTVDAYINLDSSFKRRPQSTFIEHSISEATADTLAMAARETELQKLLADERMRSEQHKMNYQTLKLEHKRLQDEHFQLRAQMASWGDDKKAEKNASAEALQKTREELNQALNVIADLKGQVLTPQRLELLKLKHEEHFQKKYQEAVAKLEADNEKLRAEFNQLRYEYTFVRVQLEHDNAELDRKQQEQKLKYETELVSVRKENEALLKEKINDESKKIDATESLQKENFQLNLRITELTQELKDSRARWDEADTRAADDQRQHVREIAELSSKLKSLELEKSSWSEQCSRLQKNLNKNHEMASKMKSELSESNIETNRLKLQLEDADHKAHLHVLQCRADLATEKAELERENAKLHAEIKHLTIELANATNNCEKHAQKVTEKEKEMTNRLLNLQQEERNHLNKVKNENDELGKKCQELEKRLLAASDWHSEALAKMETKMVNIGECNLALEKENLVLRTRVEDHLKVQMEMASQKLENKELLSQLSKLKTNLASTGEVEELLVARNKELNIALDMARKEIESRLKTVDDASAETDRLLQRQELKLENEKMEFRRNVSKLETRVKDLRHTIASNSKVYSRKTSKYRRLITKLRNRLELQQAKLDELGIQREALKRFVPHEVHNTLKKQLRDLQHRHEEFRKLLQAKTTPGNDAPLFPFESLASVWIYAEQELQQSVSMKSFQDRLKELRDKQSRQMEELVELKGQNTNA